MTSAKSVRFLVFLTLCSGVFLSSCVPYRTLKDGTVVYHLADAVCFLSARQMTCVPKDCRQPMSMLTGIGGTVSLNTIPISLETSLQAQWDSYYTKLSDTTAQIKTAASKICLILRTDFGDPNHFDTSVALITRWFQLIDRLNATAGVYKKALENIKKGKKVSAVDIINSISAAVLVVDRVHSGHRNGWLEIFERLNKARRSNGGVIRGGLNGRRAR